MTSENVALLRAQARAFLPGPVSRIAFGALLVAIVVRMTGDVSPGNEHGVTAALVAHLLLLPLLALALWAAAPRSGGIGRPRPVVLTVVALALGYLADTVVTGTFFPGMWDTLLGGMELDGLVYGAMLSAALLALALVVQVVAFRGWLGPGRLRTSADVVCWVAAAVATAVLVTGVAHVDFGDYLVGVVAAGSAWCAAVTILAVVAWRVDRLAGIGALLHVATALLLPVAAMGWGVGPDSLRLSAVTYIVGQALLAAGVLRRLRRTTADADRPL